MVSTRQLLLCLFPAFIAPVFAQTSTSCDPTKKSCPADPALGIDYLFNFTSAPTDDSWNMAAGTGAINYGSNGAEFTISEKLQSPTMQSKFYIFFGRVEVHMRAASGQGIVSSVVLESDDLDEVDWEFLGGNNTSVETNYFGKGNVTVYDRAIYYPVTDPIGTFHNYTTLWTADKLEWYVDGVLVRTLLQPDADDNGIDYPQTPMYVRIGIWAGGDPTENSAGTVTWAGGDVDYSKGPYTMYVSQVRITDAHSGKEYSYGDMTGTWQSIKVTTGNSTVASALLATPAPTTAQKWAATSSTVKISVFAISGAIGLALVSALSFCCIKRRKSGAQQRLAHEEAYENQRLEMQVHQQAYQRNMGLNLGYQGLAQPQGPLSPADVRTGGYENDRYDTRSLDERPREGHGFIS